MRRSKFSLSHYRLTTLNMGQLVPVACLEVLPGDSFRHATNALLRVTPLVAPVMHPCHAYLHHWFVPNRLVWDGWEDFITGKSDDTVPTVNYIPDSADLIGYLGAAQTTIAYETNALPLYAYNLIYNEFYRDQDLQSERTNTANSIANVAWEKDYFTTARPYPQQGEDTEAVQINLAADLPLKGMGIVAGGAFAQTNGSTRETGGTTRTYADYQYAGAGAPNNFNVEEDPDNPGYPYLRIDAGTAAGTMDINAWRQAMALQRLREHRNRFGSRYTDYLRYLGITPSDSRLQRPEYLGGGKSTIAFSEVLSTAETDTGTLGQMAGHGIAGVSSRPYNRFFEEHGHVISLLFVRPKTIYSTQVERKWLRRSYTDFWQRETEMMGDQAITLQEVYAESESSDVFGYIPRHDDYRHERSSVTGEFATSAYNSWHFARTFSSAPALNSAFITCTPSVLPFASSVTNTMQVMVSHQIAARRLVKKAGTH